MSSQKVSEKGEFGRPLEDQQDTFEACSLLRRPGARISEKSFPLDGRPRSPTRRKIERWHDDLATRRTRNLASTQHAQRSRLRTKRETGEDRRRMLLPAHIGMFRRKAGRHHPRDATSVYEMKACHT